MKDTVTISIERYDELTGIERDFDKQLEESVNWRKGRQLLAKDLMESAQRVQNEQLQEDNEKLIAAVQKWQNACIAAVVWITLMAIYIISRNF